MSNDIPSAHWDEDTSQRYLDYGKYFVPGREQQMRMMVDLLKGIPPSSHVLELCCGEGLLAEMILEAMPGIKYWGLDGSDLMLARAKARLSRFGERVMLGAFELADRSWRKLEQPVQAAMSSLGIHHLDGEGKRQLFADVYGMLDTGGGLIVADMVEPVTEAGKSVASDAWDEVVRQRSVALDGDTAGLDFFRAEHWNTYRYPDPDDIDHPSPLLDQLKWLEQAGFSNVDVHFMQAGHALFSSWKPTA